MSTKSKYPLVIDLNRCVGDNEDTLFIGTKFGKILERQLQKDFQIGLVESLAQEMAESEEAPVDVFGSIAKIVKHGKSVKEKKDWNAIARSNTVHSNPIGTKRSSLVRRQQRSIRRQLIDEANLGLDMDTDKVVG